MKRQQQISNCSSPEKIDYIQLFHWYGEGENLETRKISILLIEKHFEFFSGNKRIEVNFINKVRTIGERN